MVVTDSTLLFGRLPLFEHLLAELFRLVGADIDVLRGLIGALGIVTVAALYAVARQMSRDGVLALVAAGLLAIYPRAVIYSRFGFSYNLLAPLVLLVMGCLWAYIRAAATQRPARRWLAAAALLIG